MTEDTQVEEQIEDQEHIEISEGFFLGDLTQFVLDEMKAMPNTWLEMSEKAQDEVIERLQRRAASITARAIDILASQSRPVVKAKVEQVTFKGGIKAVLAVAGDAPFRHELADADGQEVAIVIKKAEAILGNKDGMPEADADQAELKLADDPLLDDAHQAVKELDRITVSALQRSLKVGYNRAASLLEQLQTAGWVTEEDKNGARFLVAGTSEQKDAA